MVEPDDDRWNAYCTALERYEASTWGNTKEEAFKHIVVQMIVEELLEDDIPFPKEPKEEVEVFPESRIAVADSTSSPLKVTP